MGDIGLLVDERHLEYKNVPHRQMLIAHDPAGRHLPCQFKIKSDQREKEVVVGAGKLWHLFLSWLYGLQTWEGELSAAVSHVTSLLTAQRVLKGSHEERWGGNGRQN